MKKIDDPLKKSDNTDTAYCFQVVCKLPWWDETAHEVAYSYVRVNAFASGWYPRDCPNVSVADGILNFLLGEIPFWK